MSSRLVYFGNVITRAAALSKENVIAEPVWLKACQKFPPLSEPINPILPDWENIKQTKTHRVGPFFRKDGHRYDPKKPTVFPADKQLTHPDQPPHIFFSKDLKRNEFFTLHPEEPIIVSSTGTRCEKWIEEGGEKKLGEFILEEELPTLRSLEDEFSDLMECKTEEKLIETVQEIELLHSVVMETTAVQTEINTDSIDLEQTALDTDSEVIAPNEIQESLQTKADVEDQGNSLMMYGIKEEKEEILIEKVQDVLSHLQEKPRVISCDRLGKAPAGGRARTRPIRFYLSGADQVEAILKKAPTLKAIEEYSAVYIKPYRTPEQMADNRRLIDELKRRRKEQPEKKHYIQNNTVQSRDV